MFGGALKMYNFKKLGIGSVLLQKLQSSWNLGKLMYFEKVKDHVS